MNILALPIATCLFLYVFYRLTMKNDLQMKAFIAASALSCFVVGTIAWSVAAIT